MRIAMIGQKGIPVQQGGVERHVEELSRALVSAGHTVSVYGRTWFTKRQDGILDGVKLIHTPGIKTKHLDAITHTFTALIHAMFSGVDVIHFHAVGPSLLSWIPRIFTPQITVISTFHCIDRKHEKWGVFAKIVLWIGEWSATTFPHKTIAVSKTIRQYIRDTYSSEATYIPNGVPKYNKIDSTTALEKFNITPKKYILAVSRLIAHKATHHTIAAFIQAKMENKIPSDTKLVVVGNGHYTDKYEQYLNMLAAGREDIIFTGAQYGTALAELYSHATLYVHTSLNEGMPITVLEAMSYGLPIVVSDIPEHCELIRDTNYHCHVNDIRSITDKITEIYNKNKYEQEEIGLLHSNLIERDFNWKDIAKNTLQIYKSTEKTTKIKSDFQKQALAE